MKSKEEKNNMLERENGTGESRRLFSLLIFCVIIFNIISENLFTLFEYNNTGISCKLYRHFAFCVSSTR